MDRQAFEQHLVWAEAERLFPYRCTDKKLTIGIGRNLDDKGISRAESRYLLSNDINAVVDDCRTLPYWDALDSVRQLVVADMVFNLGFVGFLGFKKLNTALREHNYSLAAHEMKDSLWYRQVNRRAVRLYAAMITGKWEHA